jgi:YVTN family beta-propeller protein
VAASPTGNIYVVNGVVSVINPTNAVTGTLTPGFLPGFVAVSPTGAEAGNVYVTNLTGTVSVFDSANNPVTTVQLPGTTPEPYGVAVSPTGAEAGYVYTANSNTNAVSVINPATNAVVQTIDVGNHPLGVAVSPTGPQAGDVYVTNAADDTVSVISFTGE